MGRGIPVVLDTINFSNQASALKFFQLMLNRYIPGERVSEDDSLHLAALLKRHAEYRAKVGCGVDHFEVMAADFNTQCFCVVRTDGTRDDFSYPHCVKHRKN